MKKTLIILIALVSLQLNAQHSFYKGVIVADMNYGIDVYNVHYHYELKTSPFTKYDTYDKAGSKGFSLGGQYGIAKWFGLGLRTKFDNYFVSKDTATNITPKVNSFEIGLVTDFHMLRKKHFDLSAGLDIGYSNFVYKSNNKQGDELYGSGLWTNFHIIPRVYFGRFGINIALNFPALTYKNMTFSNSDLNKYINPTWKASGFGATFGIQYRFMKEEDKK